MNLPPSGNGDAMSHPRSFNSSPSSYEELREMYLSLDAETREKLGIYGMNHYFVMFNQLVEALKKSKKQVTE